MNKTQINMVKTLANDRHILGKVPGLFHDELGNTIVTNGAMAAIVNDYPYDTTNIAPKSWEQYRKTLESTVSNADTTITLDMLKGKPELVAVHNMAFSVKLLRRIVKLCGGQCTISAISGTPQKFYGRSGVIGLVMPCYIKEGTEVGTL